MSSPIAESRLPDKEEGIVIVSSRDYVIVWSKEIGRIYFPIECATDQFTGGDMSRAYGVGRWVRLNVVQQDEKLGCLWKAEHGGKLAETKMAISKYEDGFDVSGLGRVARLWGDSGIIWSEKIGRIHFDRKTQHKNHGQTEDDLTVGMIVAFVAEPDVRVGIKIFNELMQRDVQLDGVVDVTAEQDYMKNELQWRATGIDTNIFTDRPPRELATVSAKFHSGMKGGVVLYSDELADHILITRFDFNVETRDKAFLEEMRIQNHFTVQVVPAMKGYPVMHRALCVNPVQMDRGQQFGNQWNSAMRASVGALRGKQNEDEVNAWRLEEDRRRAALAREEHEAFLRQMSRSILGDRSSSDQSTASRTMSSSSQSTLTDHQQHAGPVLHPGLRRAPSQKERPHVRSENFHQVTQVDARIPNSPPNKMPNSPRVTDHGQPQSSGSQYRAPVMQPPRTMQRIEVGTQTVPQTDEACLQQILVDTEIRNVLVHRPAIMAMILNWTLSSDVNKIS